MTRSSPFTVTSVPPDSEYGGTEVTLDGEDYVILDEGSVLAINPEKKPAKKGK